MNEEKKLRLTVASSPHVASPIDTTNLMRDVLIALVPAMVMGVVFFGPRALVATIISVLACEFFEWGYRKLMHKSCAVKDLSAAVTGVLLAFVCAASAPAPGPTCWAAPRPWPGWISSAAQPPCLLTSCTAACCPMPPSSTHLWAMWAAVSVRSPPWPCCWAACI